MAYWEKSRKETLFRWNQLVSSSEKNNKPWTWQRGYDITSRKRRRETSMRQRALFNTMAWEDLRNTLACKPKMYQLWFNKQGSDHCGTGVMLKRWEKTAVSRCHNCRIMNEDAVHIKKCTNKDRRLMLIKCFKEIKEWMVDNHTYPELIERVP